eukprot:Mrub_02171.p1 GENE.Mrub_02171~~Mrub_02171.p1  ORF type:complete len:580 (+),score=119.21 Mrub_02171:78-1742(+)
MDLDYQIYCTSSYLLFYEYVIRNLSTHRHFHGHSGSDPPNILKYFVNTRPNQDDESRTPTAHIVGRLPVYQSVEAGSGISNVEVTIENDMDDDGLSDTPDGSQHTSDAVFSKDNTAITNPALVLETESEPSDLEHPTIPMSIGNDITLACTSTGFKPATNSTNDYANVTNTNEAEDELSEPHNDERDINPGLQLDSSGTALHPDTTGMTHGQQGHNHYSYTFIPTLHTRPTTIPTTIFTVCPVKQNGELKYIYNYINISYDKMSDNVSNDQSQMSETSNQPTHTDRRKKYSSKVPKPKTVLPSVHDTRVNNNPNAAKNSALGTPANNRTGQHAPNASNTGSLGSATSMADMNPNDFLANIATLLDTKVREITERMDEHEGVIQDKVDAQDERIEDLENHISDLTNAFNALRQDFEVLRNQPVQPAQLIQGNNNGPKDRILHGTDWPLLPDGDPWVPEQGNAAFAKFFEVVDSIEHTGEYAFIFWARPGFTYWAVGKAIALHWQLIRAFCPNLDIRSRRERGRNAGIDQSRFHLCPKTWDAAKNGNRKVQVGNFP